MLKKVLQQGRSERQGTGIGQCQSQSLEPLSEARTKLTDFFSILLDLMFQDDEKSKRKEWCQPP